MVIPDTQVKPGVPLDHFRWIGAAIKKYAPDVIVHLGDHWDFPSLSTYAGPLEKEGRRYQADLDAGNEALHLLHEAMGRFRGRKVLLRGNHEDRLTRALNASPTWSGAVGFHQFDDRKLGWEVVDYFHGSPKPIEIDGVTYAHYFPHPNTGKPIGGMIPNLLSKVGTTFVQGHVQGLLQGNVQYATGRIRRGIVAGSCYLHDEEYKGMANAHFRGIVVLNEVRNGQFYEMAITLDHLCRKAEGRGVASFLRRNYKRADDRFTLARGE
ncbi:MAG: metallophosphoesterase [Bradyrhizobium sp.]|nr:metallophosphoesterase [Bradyrhizobium sp.]